MRPESSGSSWTARNGAGAATSVPRRRLRERFKQAIAGGLYHSGLLQFTRALESTHELETMKGHRFPLLRRFAGSKFGILCYHRVGMEGVPLFSRLEPRVFAAQMRYIKKNYRVVPLAQMCREMEEGCGAPPTLAVTFDDGYRDLYTHAFPVLREYDIPATIYLIGRCMETGEAPWYDRIFAMLKAAPVPALEVELGAVRRFELSTPALRSLAAWEIVCHLRTISDAHRRQWCSDFERQIPPPESDLSGRMLDWERVQTMHQAGVSFGAHTMTHPAVSRLDATELEWEIGETKRVLEGRLCAPIEDFAYPFGKPSDCSSVAEEIIRRCGYRSAVTTSEGHNRAGVNLYQLRRLQIGECPAMSSFAFTVNRMFLEATVGASTGTADILTGVDVQLGQSSGRGAA